MGRGGERAKVAVVTGASVGVGRAAALEFARRGLSVGLVARGLAGLDEARREIEDLGGRAIVVPADVARFDEVEAAANEVERALGPIDAWVNAASTSVVGPASRTSAEEHARVIEVRYLGAVHGTLVALRRMLARDRGVIVQPSWASALLALPLQSATMAAERAVLGFSESLRVELLHDRSAVAVSVVRLPELDSPRLEAARLRFERRVKPVGPVLDAERAARAIVETALHPRRERDVGSAPRAMTLRPWGPAPLARAIARHAWTAQETDAPPDPNRPDDLWAPMPVDLGVHRSEVPPPSRAPRLRVRRNVLALVAAGIAGAAWIARAA